MAGIAGWIAPAHAALDEQALGPMLGALAQRGIGALVGYAERGARRQAVLGAARVDDAARIALALDGRIANARELRAQLSRHTQLRDGSCEELLLHAYLYWDKELLRHLRGAFAFAIWDARKDRLLLARDRFGEKPLYLHEKRGALFFASEAKCFLGLPGFEAQADAEAIREFLRGQPVAGPRTLFAGVRKLAPGSYAVWQNGKLHEARYWTPPDRAPCVGRREAQPVEGFIAALEESVALHRAEGLLLSGGLDSAVLLAVAAAKGEPPQTFSLGFAGDPASELPAAAQAAKHFGARHHETVVTPEELMAHLEYLIAARDAPLPHPSDLALCRLAAEAGRHVASVMTGDGCDEVLGGYRRYVKERWLPAKCEAEVERDNSPLRRALYADQSGSLPDVLLERIDRGAAGLAAHLPFLDHRLAEFVSALPDGERVRGLTTKRILREAGERLLPPALTERRQGGMRLDFGAWLRKELRAYAVEHLGGASSASRAHHDGAALQEHLAGRRNHAALLWRLLNLELWLRAYRLQ